MIRHNNHLVTSFLAAKTLLLCLVAVSLTDCSLVDNDNPQLAYIRLQNPSLLGDNGMTLPSNIQDAWVYIDGQLIGVFPLPSVAPVVIDQSGTFDISIRGGIKANGQTSTSEEYPFFNALDQKINLKVGDTTATSLVFTYKKDIVFDIIEDFETSNILATDIDGNLATKVERLANVGKNGSFGGSIKLDETNPEIQVSHFASFSNSKNKLGKVYLEMDYLIGETLFVGTITQTNSAITKVFENGVGINTSWKRIYIDLSAQISKTTVVNYSLVLGSKLNTAERKTAILLIDNIRLVHF